MGTGSDVVARTIRSATSLPVIGASWIRCLPCLSRAERLEPQDDQTRIRGTLIQALVILTCDVPDVPVRRAAHCRLRVAQDIASPPAAVDAVEIVGLDRVDDPLDLPCR